MCASFVYYWFPIKATTSLPIKAKIFSFGGPLSHCSPVVMSFDRRHPSSWNFYSTIPVDVVRVKSYMNCLFDFERYMEGTSTQEWERSRPSPYYNLSCMVLHNICIMQGDVISKQLDLGNSENRDREEIKKLLEMCDWPSVRDAL